MQLKSWGLTVYVYLFYIDTGLTQLAQTSMISHRIIHNRALPHFKAEIEQDEKRRRENEERDLENNNFKVDRNEGVITKRHYYEPNKNIAALRKQSDEIAIVHVPYSKLPRDSRQSDEKEGSRELDEADYDDIKEAGGFVKYASSEENKVKPLKENKRINNYSGERNYKPEVNSYRKPYPEKEYHPYKPFSRFNINNNGNKYSDYNPYKSSHSGKSLYNYESSGEDGLRKPSHSSGEMESSKYEPYRSSNEDDENTPVNYQVTEKIIEPQTTTIRPKGRIVGVPPPCVRMTPPPPPRSLPRLPVPIHRTAAVAASRRPLYRIRAPMYVIRRPFVFRPPPRVLHVHHYHPPPKQQSLQLHITKIPSDDERRRRFRRLVPYLYPNQRSPHALSPASLLPPTTLSPLDLAALAYPI